MYYKVHLPYKMPRICMEFYLILRRLKQSVILIGQSLFCMYMYMVDPWNSFNS